MPDTTLPPVAAAETSAPDKPNVMGIPLARWAVISVSAIFVCYTAGSYGVKLYGDWVKTHMDESSYSDAITREMKAHDNDTGQQTTLFSDKDGPTVATYFSDGCIAIARPAPKLPYIPQGQSHVEWSLSPNRRPSSTPPDKPTSVWHARAQPPASLLPYPRTGGLMTKHPVDLEGQAIVSRADLGSIDGVRLESAWWNVTDDPKLQPIQGSCANPHAGPFNNWWGPANGCWAPLWRQWRDGCTHYQMYNTCNGQWDPQIHWTFCAAQHYY
jgi:hypothetical protein